MNKKAKSTSTNPEYKSAVKAILILAAILVLIGGASISYSVLSAKQMEDIPLNIENITDPKITDKNADKETIPAPDFTVLNYDGNPVYLSDYFGKPIVLNFWASWCGPCKIEMPNFNDTYLDHFGEVEFLMINLTDGSRETISSAKKYIESKDFKFTVFFDTIQQAAGLYQISSIPTTFFINRDGEITNGYLGIIDEATLNREIALLLD